MFVSYRGKSIQRCTNAELEKSLELEMPGEEKEDWDCVVRAELAERAKATVARPSRDIVADMDLDELRTCARHWKITGKYPGRYRRLPLGITVRAGISANTFMADVLARLNSMLTEHQGPTCPEPASCPTCLYFLDCLDCLDRQDEYQPFVYYDQPIVTQSKYTWAKCNEQWYGPMTGPGTWKL